MKSATLPSFWKAYRSLDRQIMDRASKAFRLWAEVPLQRVHSGGTTRFQFDLWQKFWPAPAG